MTTETAPTEIDAALDAANSPTEAPSELDPSEPSDDDEFSPPARAGSPAHPGATDIGPPFDLDAPELYLNRELTWLNFTWRVLMEAEDPRTPLLERVKFLAIVGSNLDEFVMKRVGGLMQQVGAGIHEPTVDGRTPAEQIVECHRLIRRLDHRTQGVLSEIKQELNEHDIDLVTCDQLEEAEQAEVRDQFVNNVFPLCTPQAMDPAHPFPFVSNLSLNLLVSLHYPKDSTPLMARVKVPIGAGIPRFMRVGKRQAFVTLEDVMAHNLDLLFPGMQIESCHPFRVTRNAVTERDEEEVDDLLALIQSELRERKFAPIVRLEVGAAMPHPFRGLLAAKFGLEEADVFEVDGMFGVRDMMELISLDGQDLHDAPHRPIDHPALSTDRNIFHTIRDAGTILLHHPYHSFATSVERFLREAREDPKVRAIKMTLYRTSADSNVVEHLIGAARNGKQVAVVVELKARFDERANIVWANRLEEAGIHVSYGVVGLKTHCKAILVVRQDYNGLRRYTHLGTGNYHATNARIYCDLGILTADDDIGHDMTELFNYLTTGYRPKRNYRKILPVPKGLKGALLDRIDQVIEAHSEDTPSRIQFKMNALEDADVTRALYRASQAGVRVDLIVRDTCRLRPGIPGLSENISVVSIVGRFLEHARIYYFRAGQEEQLYIGSADAMKRNLESRVESVVAVEDPRLRKQLRFILKTQLADHRTAWVMQSDGSYIQRQPRRRTDMGSQQTFIDWADKQNKEASRLRRRRPKGIAGGPTR